MASTTNTSTRDIAFQGLWKNNPALVQLLGLCPLLGVSSSVVNALGLGLATIAVLTSSNLLVSLFRHQVPDTIRLPVFVMIIAALTSCVELIMQAYTYELYKILGIFIPLIVTNCIILGRADAFASRNAPLPAVLDGLMMGAGFAAVLLLLGALRELIGQGTLFANMHFLLGPVAENWQITVIADYKKFLFAILPPGAFVFMGLLIALKNIADNRLEKARKAHQESTSGSKRVRVTG
ncbi:electron transport complex subunit E [Sansalvadorimonas sp. 2012CJ34-2]|uniref:Ion-translocating oxidoreductase complex subunit E n=1 Tax=Parendozoicomonas callyspongiae TaxID=2942213 RepID=A0ABT0PHZ8_9GAMM|nr:electron transport complex subunit E [Sansalvadorimonas sp. 2012CJ34-2]MCL6270974.1 electron transport complex subunit E [Sansalvadorimonas sp. 2012CJ34-2]